ncbi:MAG: HAD-IA family hydrolase [Solirubrobacterales bacterium]
MNAAESSPADRPFDAVMFDMDGTLVNSKIAIVQSYHDATTLIMGEPYPVEEEDIDRIIQLRGQETFPMIAKGDEEVAERIKVEFGKAYAIHQAEIPLFDSVVTMLEALKAGGIRLGIATSKARERFEVDMDRSGIRDFFELTITGDDVEHAKPSPEPVTKGIQQMGLEPDRVLYIGDGPNDVIAAREAGARQAGVEFGFHPEECRAENPDYMLKSYLDLIPIVLPA